MKIELDAPNIGNLEKQYLLKCLNSTYISTFGPFVKEFEKEFCKYLNCNNAIATQTGTSALHISLYELGIKEGDEVIIPSLTFIATVNPILYLKAKPVIVDIDPNTWNISCKEIKRSITQKTKAIIPVHLYGNPANMKEILNIAKENNLYIIEDATESLGAYYNKKATGTFGNLGCFSFNGNKIITTGSGGMIITNKIKQAEHIEFLINQAKDNKISYYHREIGFNYRMTNLQASLGLAQLIRLKEFLKKKLIFQKIYKETFKDLPYIKFQKQYSKAKPNWWLTCIKIEKEININKLIEKLRNKKIPTRRIFLPLCQMPYLKSFSISCKNAYEIYKKGICLPSSTVNSIEDIQSAAFIIKDTIKNMI